MSRHFSAAASIVALATIAAPAPSLAQSANATRSISASDKATGAQANPQLTAEYGGAYTGPQAAYVTRVGQRVAVESGLSNARGDFIVTLLNSPVENAFAIPGGYIYVTRQLLALMNSEAELASVLGHEVGHVAARHSAKRNTRAQIGGIAAAIAGQLTGSSLASRGVGAVSQLYTLGFSRQQEYEADGFGVRYMTAAGYTPYAAADILEQLNDEVALGGTISGKQTKQPGFLSTHPNGPDRVARARKLAEATNKPDTTDRQDAAFLRMLDGLPYDDGSKRIRIVIVKAGDTVASVARQMAYPDYRTERFAVLNGVDSGGPLTPGRLMKVVVAR